MPQGPGTYGKKRGRPAKKTTMRGKSAKRKPAMKKPAMRAKRRY